MGPDFNTYAKKKETKNGCHISASGGDAIISNMKYLKKTLYCHVQNISTFYACTSCTSNNFKHACVCVCKFGCVATKLKYERQKRRKKIHKILHNKLITPVYMDAMRRYLLSLN